MNTFLAMVMFHFPTSVSLSAELSLIDICRHDFDFRVHKKDAFNDRFGVGLQQNCSRATELRTQRERAFLPFARVWIAFAIAAAAHVAILRAPMGRDDHHRTLSKIPHRKAQLHLRRQMTESSSSSSRLSVVMCTILQRSVPAASVSTDSRPQTGTFGAPLIVFYRIVCIEEQQLASMRAEYLGGHNPTLTIMGEVLKRARARSLACMRVRLGFIPFSLLDVFGMDIKILPPWF